MFNICNKRKNLVQLLSNDAIGHNPNQYEMELYAKKLIELGLHSKETILYSGVLKSIHIQNWLWMKPFHRIIFENWWSSESALASASSLSSSSTSNSNSK